MFVYNRKLSNNSKAELLLYIKSFSWDHCPNIRCHSCLQFFLLPSPRKGALLGPIASVYPL